MTPKPGGRGQTAPVPTPLPITGRPVRLAVVGLGTISELALPPYVGDAAVEIVGLCDLDADRVARWHAVFPDALATTDLDEVLRVDADVVDVLVPTPLHGDVVCRVLDAGFHVQVQKPLARTLEDADRMLAAAARTGATLRVLEDYVFYPPLVALREVLESGEIGEPAGLHMKIVATGRGGWDVPMSSYVWQFEQARDGRGMLVFDHGWHQLADRDVAARADRAHLRLAGGDRDRARHRHGRPVDARVAAHQRRARRPRHHVRARHLLPLRPLHRRRARRGRRAPRASCAATASARAASRSRRSSCTARARARFRHALPDRLPDSFAASAAHGLAHFRGETAGDPVMSGAVAREVLVALLGALESAQRGSPVDLPGTAGRLTGLSRRGRPGTRPGR